MEIDDAVLQVLLRAKEEFESFLLSLKGVVGVGIGEKITAGKGTGQPCVRVYVRRKLPEEELRRKDIVPRTLKEVRTDVIEAGDVRALAARTSRWRPAPGGVSVGHHRVTAGTLGVLFYDRRDAHPLILSNNHVLANSALQGGRHAATGDAILQPGVLDGGRQEDRIGALERWVPLAAPSAGSGLLGRLFSSLARPSEAPEAAARNLVDAAVAAPTSAAVVEARILEIGKVLGAGNPRLGLKVRKSGRTTGYTEGTITDLHATIRVGGYHGREVQFHDQIVLTTMLEGGDSGSLLLDVENRAVGLCFAGSDRLSLANPIGAVLQALDLVVAPPDRGA